MDFNVVKLPSQEWNKICDDAHVVCFEERRPGYMNRVDFALLVVDAKTEIAVGFVTVQELDSTSCYLQHGGGFPGSIGIPVFMAYNYGLSYLKNNGYKKILTVIKNTNTPMLKMAMKVGFRIVGIKNVENEIMLEHLIDLTGGK